MYRRAAHQLFSFWFLIRLCRLVSFCSARVPRCIVERCSRRLCACLASAWTLLGSVMYTCCFVVLLSIFGCFGMCGRWYCVCALSYLMRPLDRGMSCRCLSLGSRVYRSQASLSTSPEWMSVCRRGPFVLRLAGSFLGAARAWLWGCGGVSFCFM